MSVRRMIDGYRVEATIARGRSGEVFRARTTDGTRVAIKVHDRAGDADREIERLSSVDHDGVISLLAHGATGDGRRWLATPWIDGVPLSHVLRTTPGPVAEATVLISHLAAAIDALHQAGITHGDLSADNVLVTPDGRVVVIDLATPTLTDHGAIERTAGIELDATPRYTSPEVASGEPPGPASDVYALGLIAYEALTGAFPYPEVATPIAMLGHHASTDPIPPSEHRPSLPAGIDAAFQWALAKAPDERPPSGAALVDALRQSGSTAVVPPAPPSRRVIVVGVAAALIVAGIVGVVLWRADDADRTSTETPELASTTATPDSTSEPATPTAWVAGAAAGLSCNLVQAPDFDDGARPDDFYAGDPTNTTAIVDERGVDGTPALQVGADGQFGLYGEVVAIGTHSDVVLAASVGTTGAPTTMAVYVDFLDEEFVQLTAERDSLAAEQLVDGADDRVMVRASAPRGATYAVPTFFKDGSGGSMIIDEVVFGPASTCEDLAS